MSVLVATDLDRTMIYSTRARALGPATSARSASGPAASRPGASGSAASGQAAVPVDRIPDDRPEVCVEIHDGEQVSFMTADAAQLLSSLALTATVVPVTTRIDAQYRRVRLPGPPPKYAITTNGAILLVDGVPDLGWTRHVERTLAGVFSLDDVWAQVGLVCRPEFTVKLRNAAELFCYAVVRPNRLPSGFVDDVSGWAAERGWRISLQGRKLYWVPEQLTKSAAVAEVAARAGCEVVLAAGDSLLDVDLLLAADRGIHPLHGELYEQGWSAPTVVETQTSGISAGEEIVRWFDAHQHRQ